MTLTWDIPDILAASLAANVGDVRSAVIEGFAVESYRSGKLSSAEVGQLLGHASRWETELFLADHGAWPSPTDAELEADLLTLKSLRAG